MTAWARRTADRCVTDPAPEAGNPDTVTDRLDAVLTHPVGGVVAFCVVMTGLFMTIFSLATLPMDLIELGFGQVGRFLQANMAPGAIRDLLSNGLLAGVAGTLVFLPQICLLFFLISLLEDSGYLARAALVADRVLRRFGLPGHAFVPMLSAHACAIPAMMSARLIPDHRDRLATILVAPFLSCSARLPVYVLLIGFLFPGRPVIAGLAFAGCYALGAVAAVLTALLVRYTVVRGRAGAMVLELPPFQVPSLRTALLVTTDRAVVFVKSAGTVIVAICVVLWWMSAYPIVDPPAQATAWRAEASALVDVNPQRAIDLENRAGIAENRHALSNSFIGRLGHLVEPIFEPLGYDWRLSIGILSSFAAREVFVSTMIVITGTTEGPDTGRVLERIRTATRDDGTPMFTMSTAAGLLVFYVLAMQCLPTLAVTRREAGGWRWAALQLVYMSGLAYVAAFGVRWGVQMMGIT
jgi:ferrous iron transport protein B